MGHSQIHALAGTKVQVHFRLQRAPKGVDKIEDFVTKQKTDFHHLICTGAWFKIFNSIVASSVAPRLVLNPSIPMKPRASSGLSSAAPTECRSRACSSVTRYSDICNEGDFAHELPPIARFRPCIASQNLFPTATNARARSR